MTSSATLASGETNMKAAYIEATGAPEVIQYGDLPQPALKANEVLVRVEAAAVNPIDTYIRAGLVAMPMPKPFIVGCDLAGTVRAVGPAVKQWKVGDRVWGSNQGLLGRQGTFAELAAVEEHWLYPLPKEVTAEAAAAVALVGITAHLGLFQKANLQAGETVYVSGGTGGVGSMVVQMAKAVGAKVITTVGSKAKADLCRAWGADHVIQYKSEDVAAAIQMTTQQRGVDVWYETQREQNFMMMVPLMAKGGRMIVMAGRQAQPIFPVGPFYTRDLTLFGFAMFNATPEAQRQAAQDINQWLQAGKLKPMIGKRLPLSQAAEAHRLQEDNTLNKAGTLTGKIIVQIG